MLPHLLLLLFLLSSSSSSPSMHQGGQGELYNVTMAAILPINNTDYAWAWPRVGPALYRAVERVNADPALLPGIRLVLEVGNSQNEQVESCSKTQRLHRTCCSKTSIYTTPAVIKPAFRPHLLF